MDKTYKDLLEKGWKLIGINPVSKMFLRNGYRFVLQPISGVLIDKKNNKYPIPITKETTQSLEDKIIGLEETLEK